MSLVSLKGMACGFFLMNHEQTVIHLITCCAFSKRGSC